ncbi:MAG: hypothetical protein KAI33_11590, partial [Elusimicrobiales bacterium]|nr:hypothetical protein [Elusimicrobiales bacterium]
PMSRPVVPSTDTAYNSLSTLSGTSIDGITTVDSVVVCILSEDEAGGPKYFTGVGFTSDTEVWIDVSELYPSSWTYSSGALTPKLENEKHYVIKSSATDSIGNVQDTVGSSRFLIDKTRPASSFSDFVSKAVYDDQSSILGPVSDPGFVNGVTEGINGTGSGLYRSFPWHQGKVEIAIFRDTAPMIVSDGPISLGSQDNSGYYWNGSTWTVASDGIKWIEQFTTEVGLFDYGGLVCDSADPCWVRGETYITWVKATDNAGNVQSAIELGPKFKIAAPAQSFALSVSADPITAGDATVELRVMAMDAEGGLGSVASAYQGTVKFSIDGGAGPETMDDNGSLEDTDGLPEETVFLEDWYGDSTTNLKIKLRKADIGRVIKVEDTVDDSIDGFLTVNVIPTTADRIQVIADIGPTGQQHAPGKMEPFGEEGRENSPGTKFAGADVPFLIQVTDKYWNLVVSSAASVDISDNDDNNSVVSPDSNEVFVGSTTINRKFSSASPTGWNVRAEGQGLYSNASNPSSNVPIVANTADRLLVLFDGETRVPGKTTEPKGKTGTPDDQVVGSTFSATVFGVDEYYNTDAAADFYTALDITTDKYDVNPSSQPLESGATVFVFTSVVASSHTIKAESDSLPQATSVYYTPNEVPVWWSNPVKLHLLAEGQNLDPGKPDYDTDPATGGRENSPADLTAGIATQITVNLVDEFYNVVKGTTPFLAVSSNTPLVELQFVDDPNIEIRGLGPTTNPNSLNEYGTATFSFVPVTRNPSGMSLRVIDTHLAWNTNYSTDTLSNVNGNGIVVNSTNAVALQLLVKDEVPDEGSLLGKTGASSPLTAGTAYTIKARSVDKYWNLSPIARNVVLTSNDIYAEHPAAQALGAGQADIIGFLPSAATGNLVINIVDNGGGGPPALTTQSNSNITVNTGDAEKMIVVLPTQYLVPGKVTYPYGVDGTISTQTAGVFFDAWVYAADSRYNKVSGIDKDNIKAISNDPFFPTVGFYDMTGGSIAVTDIKLRTAGDRSLTLEDLSGDPSPFSDGESGTFPLIPNNPTNLRVLVPDEARESGSNDVRSGVVDSQKAGVAFDIVVDITDGFWNLTPGASQEIRITCDDSFATIIPSTLTITSSATISVLPIRAGDLQITAETKVNPNPPWGPDLAQDNASLISVSPGDAVKLLLVMPGEDFDPGSATGKKDSPTTRKAGEDFT